MRAPLKRSLAVFQVGSLLAVAVGFVAGLSHAQAGPRGLSRLDDTGMSAGLSACTVSGTYVAAPDSPRLCDDIDVTLAFSITCPARPLHVILAAEDSSAIWCYKSQYLASVRRVVDAFERLDQPVKMGLVIGRHPRVRAEVELTDDLSDVSRGIGAIRIAYSEANAMAEDLMIEEALDMLERGRGDGAPKEAIVLMSDSLEWSGIGGEFERIKARAIAAANRARSVGDRRRDVMSRHPQP